MYEYWPDRTRLQKTLMQNFCIAYRGILSKHNLFATGTTGVSSRR